MRLSMNFLMLIVLVGLLCGCQTSKVLSSIPEATAVNPKPVNVHVDVSQSVENQEAEKPSAYDEVMIIVSGLKVDASAQEIANILIKIEVIGSSTQISEQDLRKIGEIEGNLLSLLRTRVKIEVSALRERSLKSSTYREGYELARDAESVLMLYPLSDLPSTIKEAEELSFRQKEILPYLEQIRIQRYNYWAAKQAEKALKDLREGKKGGASSALLHLRVIDPKLLESSVASLYSYCVTEIMDKFDKNEKATVAKELTNPSVTRRSLVEF